MNRLSALALLALLAWHQPALAGQEIADPVVARIEAEGYTVSDVRRTWLGRIVITARSATYLRETVLNRTSGEVLRDQLFPLDNSAPIPPTIPDPATPDDAPDDAGDTLTDVPDVSGTLGGAVGAGVGGIGGVGGSAGVGGIGGIGE